MGSRSRNKQVPAEQVQVRHRRTAGWRLKASKSTSTTTMEWIAAHAGITTGCKYHLTLVCMIVGDP
jgi:hypothetical protein